DERAARIAGVDSRVGLDERLELPVGNDAAAFRRNNSCCDGRLQPEGATDGQYPVADLHAFRVAKFRDRQCVIHFDLDNRKVRLLVGAYDRGVVLHAGRIILQSYADTIGLFDHVPVGDNVTFRIYDHARSERALFDWTGILVSEEFVEEVAERIGIVVVFTAATRPATPSGRLDRGFGVDVDD